MRTFKPLTRQEPIRDTYHSVIGHREVEVRDSDHRVIMVENCACGAPKMANPTPDGIVLVCLDHQDMERRRRSRL